MKGGRGERSQKEIDGLEFGNDIADVALTGL
jgi:hypothetical protein